MNVDPYRVRFPDAHARFPEAFVAFDAQSDIHDADDLAFRLYRKSGTYARGGGFISRDRLLVVARGRQFVWHPKAMVWVRGSFGFPSRPYKVAS